MPAKKRSKYKFRVSDEIADFIKNVHPELKRKIKSALKDIPTDPYIGKPLRDELKGFSSVRVSRFRIIYRISSKQIIELIAIGPRKIIYELTYRVLKKEEKKKK
jgi:mRNA interferase RelE/StbE